MARLHKKSIKLPAFQSRDTQVPYTETEHYKAFERLCETQEMVSFGVGDGFAWYIVKSRKPLVLQHVDYMDGYAIPAAMIRGLRIEDMDLYSRWGAMGFKF